jgi:putative glutathione S-transferase
MAGTASSKKVVNSHQKKTDTTSTSVSPNRITSYHTTTTLMHAQGLFCPFAHRPNLVRHLKHLQAYLPISIVRPYPKGEPGWRFDASYPNATPDHLFNSQFMHQIYFRDDPAYKGKYSVPLLWDKKTNRIVNNESAEMLKWLPHAFDSILESSEKVAELDFYPQALRGKIDEISPWLQSLICTGVYKAGFAQSQEGYEANVVPLFAALNRLEDLLHSNGGPYILGDTLTELDLLAYPTIVRFDTVYSQHFKTNLGSVRHDYPVLNNWLKNLYHNVEGFKESTDFRHIKENVSRVIEARAVWWLTLIARFCSIPRVMAISIHSVSRLWDRIRMWKRGMRGIGVS